ncbi:MAG TPA: glucosyl-3-phosphoglycerate synthase, partial [Actinomycetota bacterium]|nr:glucosyl-3-phosphoglycerate synthase [Actinomycetota bacterium]
MIPAPTDWFARRTFHHRQYPAEALVRAKRERGLTVSVCIPTLNEEETIGPIVRTIRTELVERTPLVDELAVIDSSSSDRTAEEARSAGALVVQDGDALPEVPPLAGKGEALWKSLFFLRGDVILWLDADIRNFDPRFVCGPLGPILSDPEVGYVKSFYRRPIADVSGVTSLEGGRVTELVARPLINLFWPHLAGLIQPLAGEYAGRRDVLERVPFFTGYGVEMGLIIDVAERFGVEAMAQVDREERVHRNRSLEELSRMSFAVLHAALRRLAERHDIDAGPAATMYQFASDERGYRME